MKKSVVKILRLATGVGVFACVVCGQDPSEQPLKITTEEVHLNVTAQSVNGKFVPTLTRDDLLIVESGTPQKIESMKKMPASVLLLLDTGGNLNFAKTLKMTRLTAKLVAEKLAPDNTLAVIQAYNKVETVAHWTKDRAAVQKSLDDKLFNGGASRFTESVNAALKMFESRPLENRHLVFIGDGLDSAADEETRGRALQALSAANVTVHIIAYNNMESRGAEKATRRIQKGEKNEAPRMPEFVAEEIIRSIPQAPGGDAQDNFRAMIYSERLIVIRLDKKARKLAKEKRERWIKSEGELQRLAEDTGGFFQSPDELPTMWLAAMEIAKAVDSQYVVTYIPTKPFADAEMIETRKVRVGTHCDGVLIRSRQQIVVVPKSAAQTP
jgi:VWFA-related protein